MTGIEFIARDLAGWRPPIAPPAPFTHPEFLDPAVPVEGAALTPENIEYLRDMAGVVPVRELAQRFGISRGTLHNIQSGKRGAGANIVPRAGHQTTPDHRTYHERFLRPWIDRARR